MAAFFWGFFFLVVVVYNYVCLGFLFFLNSAQSDCIFLIV